jgi:hypothetical protein
MPLWWQTFFTERIDMSGRGMSRSAPGIIQDKMMMVGRFFRNHLLWPAAGDCSCEKKHKRWYRIVRIVAHGAQRTKSPDRLHRVIFVKLGKSSPARRACTHRWASWGWSSRLVARESGGGLFESFCDIPSDQNQRHIILLHRLVCQGQSIIDFNRAYQLLQL